MPVVFGDGWDDTIVPLQLLCIGGMAASLVNLHWACSWPEAGVDPGPPHVRVVDRQVGGGRDWSTVGDRRRCGIVWAARWFLVVPSTWFTTRGVSFGFWPALRAGTGILPAAIAAGVVGVVAREVLLATSTPRAARLIVVALAMFIVYAAILLATAPSVVHEMRRVFRNRAIA